MQKATEKISIKRGIKIEHEPEKLVCLWADIPGFLTLVQACMGTASAADKKANLEKSFIQMVGSSTIRTRKQIVDSKPEYL